MSLPSVQLALLPVHSMSTCRSARRSGGRRPPEAATCRSRYGEVLHCTYVFWPQWSWAARAWDRAEFGRTSCMARARLAPADLGCACMGCNWCFQLLLTVLHLAAPCKWALVELHFVCTPVCLRPVFALDGRHLVQLKLYVAHPDVPNAHSLLTVLCEHAPVHVCHVGNMPMRASTDSA